MTDISPVQVAVTMNDDDWDNLLITAFYDGIWYWATDAERLPPNRVRICWNDDIGPRHKTINIHDVENAWAKIISKEIALGDWVREYFLSGDMGDIDSVAADCLIQAALFGEIVYG